MGYAVYFFEQVGLSTTISFDFSLALYSVAIVGVFISWSVMTSLRSMNSLHRRLEYGISRAYGSWLLKLGAQYCCQLCYRQFTSCFYALLQNHD
jgi:hypothetical protein